MKKPFPLLLLILFFAVGIKANVLAQDSDKAILSELLDDFLAGASVNDAEMHDRFWAEDLIYTGSNGTRITKPDIMAGLDNQPQESDDEAPVYHAEEVQIQLYGETAVVAFRLVAKFESGNDDDKNFYNTGTFVKRDGEWRAVAWQATRIPN
jgi:hypothetical protein